MPEALLRRSDSVAGHREGLGDIPDANGWLGDLLPVAPHDPGRLSHGHGETIAPPDWPARAGIVMYLLPVERPRPRMLAVVVRFKWVHISYLKALEEHFELRVAWSGEGGKGAGVDGAREGLRSVPIGSIAGRRRRRGPLTAEGNALRVGAGRGPPHVLQPRPADADDAGPARGRGTDRLRVPRPRDDPDGREAGLEGLGPGARRDRSQRRPDTGHPGRCGTTSSAATVSTSPQAR